MNWFGDDYHLTAYVIKSPIYIHSPSKFNHPDASSIWNTFYIYVTQSGNELLTIFNYLHLSNAECNFKKTDWQSINWIYDKTSQKDRGPQKPSKESQKCPNNSWNQNVEEEIPNDWRNF